MRKMKAQKRRGIVGIEAAVVLIAFVLVAASLAFVALNMGMFATQRTKEVIGKAYESSSRALEVSGSVLADMAGTGTSANDNPVNYILVPIRLTAGSKAIDATKFLIVTNILFPDGSAQSYSCPFAEKQFVDASNLDLSAEIPSDLTDDGDATLIGVSGSIEDGKLDPNDLIYLIVSMPDNVVAYSYITIEIQTPTGNALTVSRVVPATTAAGLINLDMTS
ncbi:MAG: archaellin/type IV pilin N-terminal domain-containing protein [Nitrososphaeria archaeon]